MPPAIQRLSNETINQIAAGEVVERPASVVKELLENALDSGARRVEVATGGGGLALIRVTDNGSGMAREDLKLAVERHCTSKLSGGLSAIETLGFRGEALASIGAVARLSVASRQEGSEHGWRINIEGGTVSEIEPAAINAGTQIEVRDLFFATPARLKFMKSERAETAAISEVVRQAAMAFPGVRFVLSGSDRSLSDFGAAGAGGQLRRMEQILGAEFRDNALPIDADRNDVRLSGFVSLPTFNRGNAARQYFFVNGRPVRDKQLFGALRAAYSDVLARDRHAVAALFIDLHPSLVDVNVHPAKAEVRFRDPGLVRGLIVGAIKQALTEAGHRSASTGGLAMQSAFVRPGPAPSPLQRETIAALAGFSEGEQAIMPNLGGSADTRPLPMPDTSRQTASSQPLGVPRAQLHENYIVTQTADGVTIVDQHAAHERLVYERLKDAIATKGITTQMLLVPEVVELPEDDVARLISRADELADFGLTIEGFGPGAITVREMPAILDGKDAKGLINDIVDELADLEATTALSDRIEKVLGTMACHGSVRSGRRLRPEEMDALLRQMEATPLSGQCIHGRPTYIELKLSDIERLFGRK